jgi:hypothetical protein
MNLQKDDRVRFVEPSPEIISQYGIGRNRAKTQVDALGTIVCEYPLPGDEKHPFKRYHVKWDKFPDSHALEITLEKIEPPKLTVPETTTYQHIKETIGWSPARLWCPKPAH